jgi:hypothetical protein
VLISSLGHRAERESGIREDGDLNMPSLLILRPRRLALITIVLPIAAWALQRAAQRAETRDPRSLASRRLRQAATLAERYGRGPLRTKRQRRSTTVTSIPGNGPEVAQHDR